MRVTLNSRVLCITVVANSRLLPGHTSMPYSPACTAALALCVWFKRSVSWWWFRVLGTERHQAGGERWCRGGAVAAGEGEQGGVVRRRPAGAARHGARRRPHRELAQPAALPRARRRRRRARRRARELQHPGARPDVRALLLSRPQRHCLLMRAHHATLIPSCHVWAVVPTPLRMRAHITYCCSPGVLLCVGSDLLAASKPGRSRLSVVAAVHDLRCTHS